MLDDTLFTVEEVAARLGVHPETVRKWIKNKDLPAVNLGGRAGYRISRAALERFLKQLQDNPSRDER